MPDCPLLSRCPYANDVNHVFSEMSEGDKERYCKGDYAWCGRYMTYRARQKGPDSRISPNWVDRTISNEPSRE